MKWTKYKDRDILPFWVADMDFATPSFLIDAIKRRLEHPILGYTSPPSHLATTVAEWAESRFNWRFDPKSVVWMHGVVPGLNTIVSAIAKPNDGLVVPYPIYPPFRKLGPNANRAVHYSKLQLQDGRYVMDYEDIEAKCRASAAIVISNPQNPTGRVYTKDELRKLGDICLRTNTLLISDEIHWGLILDETRQHTPVASLSDEIAHQTVTITSHTKSYNLAGVQCALAVVNDQDLRKRIIREQNRMFGSISPLGYAGAESAFLDRSPWLGELTSYLRRNRDFVDQAVRDSEILKTTHVEGTHLTWIDASAIPVQDPHAFFEAFGLGFSPGVDFGQKSHVRFNFAAPYDLVREGCDRLLDATDCVGRS